VGEVRLKSALVRGAVVHSSSEKPEALTIGPQRSSSLFTMTAPFCRRLAHDLEGQLSQPFGGSVEDTPQRVH
jgi:hypothetical protein